MAPITIPVHAIVTEKGFADEAAVKAMLDEANKVYSSIELTFGLASSEVDADPALQKDVGSSVPTSGSPLELELAREAKAARFPGRLVVFLRPHQSTAEFKAFSYSSTWSQYVVMGGTGGVDFAHEAGHYFHLGHTHNDTVTNDLYATNRDQGFAMAKSQAIERIRQAGGLDVFNGDLPEVQDTPADPGPPLFQPTGYDSNGNANDPDEHCTGTLQLDVDGKSYLLAPDRANIMSYFKGCPGSHNLSPDQRRIVERALSSGNRRHLVRGVAPEGPAAVVASRKKIHVFGRGDDRNIWHSLWDGKRWSGWRADLGAGTLASGPAAVTPPGGKIQVFARGDNRNIWRTSWNGKVWSGWRADLGAGTLTSGPAAAVTPDGRIHVFARGDDLNIWHTFWDGKVWSGWKADLGEGTLTSGPAAVVTSGGTIHVFARGDDRNVWHTFQTRQGWSGWRADLGVGTLTSGPAAVVTAEGHLHVFARGDDRAMWHSYWNHSVWSGWQSNLAGGTFFSGMAAVVSQGGALHAFAQGDDRTIQHSVWNGTSWSPWRADLGSGSFQP